MYWDRVEEYLLSVGGQTTVYTLRGKAHVVRLDQASQQVLLMDSPYLHPLKAEIFNEVERCVLAGITKKGYSREKLGSDKLNNQTIMGRVGYNAYHKVDGETIDDAACYIFAILAAAGIITNCSGYIR